MKLSETIPTLPSGNIYIDEMLAFGNMTVADRQGKFAKININDTFDLINKLALQYADKDAINWINDFNKQWLDK